MQQGQHLNRNLKKWAYVCCILAFLPATLFAIEVGKFQLSPYRIILFALAFLYAPLNSWQLRISKGENRYSVIFMILWLLYGITSFLWAKSGNNFIRCSYFLVAAVVLTLSFTRLMQTKEDIVKAFRIIRWAILVLMLIGWYEAFTGDYHFASDYRSALYGRKNGLGFSLPVAMSGNVNDFATLMLFGTCTLFICWRTEENPALKTIDLLGIVLCAAIIFVSESRGNIYGLLLAVIFLLIRSKESRRLLGIVIAVAVLYFGTDLVTQIFSGQAINLVDILTGEAGGSDGIRANLIRNGFVFLEKTFGFGVGLGQIETWIANEAVYSTGGMTNMHNWWMELLTSFGVIFFIAYLVFYVKLFRNQNKRIDSKDTQESAISTGIAAFMVAFLIASISSSSLFTAEWPWLFWAIAIAWQGQYEGRKREAYKIYRARRVIRQFRR